MDVFLILSSPKYNMTTRSIPMPPPACGGQPKRKASMYAEILLRSVTAQKKNWFENIATLYRLVFFNARLLTNGMMFSSFDQIISIMNTLSTRQNFFASHEHIVRIGPFLQYENYSISRHAQRENSKRASEPLQKQFGYRFGFLKKLKNGLGSGFGY